MSLDQEDLVQAPPPGTNREAAVRWQVGSGPAANTPSLQFCRMARSEVAWVKATGPHGSYSPGRPGSSIAEIVYHEREQMVHLIISAAWLLAMQITSDTIGAISQWEK